MSFAKYLYNNLISKLVKIRSRLKWAQALKTINISLANYSETAKPLKSVT